MQTSVEAVSLIYENGNLVGLVKRDEKSKKTLLYLVKEAKSDDVVKLLVQKKEDDK